MVESSQVHVRKSRVGSTQVALMWSIIWPISSQVMSDLQRVDWSQVTLD